MLQTRPMPATRLPFPTPAGSRAAAQIAATDWRATSLGPVEGWPRALCTLLATMLSCPKPMYLAWGPDLLSFYNDAYVPCLGYRAPSAMGRRLRELWSGIWDDIAPMVAKALSGGSPSVTDMRLDLSRQGVPEESYWSFSYSPAFDDAGGICGMLCVTAETTDRILAERRRDQADERLSLALAGGNGVGVWDWDVLADRVRADARFAALYGIEPARAEAGAPIGEFLGGIHPGDRARVAAEVQAAITGGGGFRSEYRLRHPDGGERWVVAQGMSVTDESGRCVRFPGVSFDITDRVLREQRLRESEALAGANAERFQLALDAGAIIGAWLWDLPGDRFTVDEGFARSFGLDPALGRDGLSLAQLVATVHPDDREGLMEAIAKAVARGGAYAHQYRVRRADGRYYWIEANGRVEHGADGTPLRFPGVLVDVERRRAVEAERDRALGALRALNEQLEQRVAERTAELMHAEAALRQSQKMEAVGQLTGGIAHDFNNLLAGISGALELMGARLAQGRLADVDRYVIAAQGAARRAAALTHRLLAFSRRQTLAPKPTNINLLVRGMTELIQRTVGPGIAVETVEASGLWTALVDAPQLENALLNLCINARDAMPEGGRITIETTNKWFDSRAARQHDMPQGQYLSLCVTDTGTGMAPEVVGRAFEPFFTTKPLGQGTGLGLSMIYGFAQQSGGQVRIYSEVGRGTTVCIYVPRHYGSPAEEAGEGAEAGGACAGGVGETVLVVDDEPTVRLLVADVLTELGYATIEAHDSVSGLKILQSAVRIDLLITDVGLPGGMNGRQLAEAGLEQRPGLRVLFITGYAENAILNNGHLAPGMAVLTKPFAVDALATRVREVLADQADGG